MGQEIALNSSDLDEEGVPAAPLSGSVAEAGRRRASTRASAVANGAGGFRCPFKSKLSELLPRTTTLLDFGPFPPHPIASVLCRVGRRLARNATTPSPLDGEEDSGEVYGLLRFHQSPTRHSAIRQDRSIRNGLRGWRGVSGRNACAMLRPCARPFLTGHRPRLGRHRPRAARRKINATSTVLLR